MGKKMHDRGRHEVRLAKRYVEYPHLNHLGRFTGFSYEWILCFVLGEISPKNRFSTHDNLTYWEAQAIEAKDSFIKLKKYTKKGNLRGVRAKPYRAEYNKAWRRRTKQFTYRMFIGDEQRAERINLEKDRGFWWDVF